MKTADAAKWADVIMIVIPDTLQAAVYKKDIAPYLEKGDALMFSHFSGYEIFKLKFECKNKDILPVLKHGAKKHAEEHFDWEKNKQPILEMLK